MAARRPFWKWHRWKSIGTCLWPPSICIWNFKLKFQSKLDLCSGNHVVYRQTDGQTDGRGESSIPPSNFVGRGYYKQVLYNQCLTKAWCRTIWMGQCKRGVTPLLTHWSYVLLALTHRYDVSHSKAMTGKEYKSDIEFTKAFHISPLQRSCA